MAQRLLLNAQGTTNQHGEFTSPINIAANENFKITIRFRRLSGNEDMEIFGTASSGSSDWVFETNAIATPISRFNGNASDPILFNTSAMYDYDFSVMETYSIERSDGQNVTLSRNGVIADTKAFTDQLSIRFLGRRGLETTIDAPLAIELFEVERDGIPVHRYNGEGTNGDSLVMPDQIGSNDITLKNMPNSTGHWESYVDARPVITLTPPQTTYDINQNDSFTYPTATATDDVDADVAVTPSGTVDTSTVGTYTLTYNHTDSDGNAATPVTVTVNVNEAGVLPPEITLDPPQTTYNINEGDSFTYPVATATDDLDADVTVTPSGTVDPNTAGTYTLTYNHTDSNGNAAQTVTVTVIVASVGEATQIDPLTLPLASNVQFNYEGTLATNNTALGGSGGRFCISEDGQSLFIERQYVVGEYRMPTVFNPATILDDVDLLEEIQAPVSITGDIVDGSFTRLDPSVPTNFFRIVGMAHKDGKLIINHLNWYDTSTNRVHSTIVVEDASDLANSVIESNYGMVGVNRQSGTMIKTPENLVDFFGGEILSFAPQESISSRHDFGPSIRPFNLEELTPNSSAGSPVIFGQPTVMEYPFTGNDSEGKPKKFYDRYEYDDFITSTYDGALGYPLNNNQILQKENGEFTLNNWWNLSSKVITAFVIPNTRTLVILSSLVGGKRAGYYEEATVQPSRVKFGLEYKYKTWYYDEATNEYKKRDYYSAGNSPAIEDDRYTNVMFFDLADIAEAKAGTRGTWDIYPYDQVLLKNLAGIGNKDGLHALPAAGYFDLTRNRLFISHAGEIQTGVYTSVPIINAINVTADVNKPVIKLYPDRDKITHIKGRPFTPPEGSAVNPDGTVTNLTPTGSVDVDTNGTYTLTYSHSFNTEPAQDRVLEVTVIDQPVLNSAPLVSVGEDFSATTGQSLSITAVVSDVDTNDLITYKWVQVGSTNLGLENGEVDLESATLTFTPPNTVAGTTQTVRCEVFDGINSDLDDVQITFEEGQVIDTLKPVITLIGANTVEVILNDSYTEQGATAIDNVDGDITNDLVVFDNIDTTTLGTYQVTYNVTDAAGNSADEVIRTVNVVQEISNLPPIANAGVDRVVQAGAEVILNGSSSSDSDGSIVSYEWVETSSSNVSLLNANTANPSFIAPTNTNQTTLEFTLTVTDNLGLTSSDSVTITVEAELTPPIITLLGDSVVTINEGVSYTDAGVTAIDSVDGDLTSSVVVVNPVDTSTVGTYSITYNVTNSSGIAAQEVTRTVIVEAVSNTIESSLSVSYQNMQNKVYTTVVVDMDNEKIIFNQNVLWQDGVYNFNFIGTPAGTNVKVMADDTIEGVLQNEVTQ
ncbi:MAG: hypothetical protein GOVbin2917_80 [Prokaryotic dsDNA virus sp.]|jgi:hypothetical protein|nr:MAG: hypothetical protein GOVbin2917_80 [Prokaryotic dsDNA virus sp.]|tara:strand:+ start:45472 stop:49470 length:3999 start_codon:yes stop_codon:yes gene_type:complete